MNPSDHMRFAAPSDLRHLWTQTPPRSERHRLPAIRREGASKKAPVVAIATPDIAGPIRNGGIGTAYASLARALASAGHQVTILYTLGHHCENGAIEDWIERYRSDSIRFVPLPDAEGPAVFHGPRHSSAAYQWLRRQRFDVIHFPEWGGTSFCSVKAKRMGLAFRDTTICVGVHSPSIWHDLENRRAIDRLDQLECDFLERQSVELADVVVSPSQYLFRWLDRWGWKTPEQSYVQPYIAPVLDSRSTGEGLRPVAELVFFGRLESRKGLELFCDAVESLTARGDCPAGLKVAFLGKVGTVAGADALDYLRSRASRWSCPWHTMTDRSQREALEYLTSRQSLAVMPSLADNTPNTVLECLGAGVPFVATAVGGIPEMIAEADRGRVLVPPEGEALARVLADRLEHGAGPARPACEPDDVRSQWVAWHEEQATRQSVQADQRPVDSQPLVSVCMATHDRPAFLSQAVASLRQQTYQAFEVILVDDGSATQEARQALNQMEPEFTALGWTLIRQPRRYPGAARNTAASKARGRYLMFMDDDNLALPAEIETFVRAAEYSGAEILTCGHDAFRGEDPPQDTSLISHRWMPLGAALPLAFFVNCVGDTNMLVRRDAFFRAGAFDEEPGAGLVEDWSFFSKAITRGVRIDLVPEILYLYRLGPHGFGQNAHAFESYARPLQPFIDILPPVIALGLLFASGGSRRPIGAATVPSTETTGQPGVRSFAGPRSWLHVALVNLLGRAVPAGDEGDHLAGRFAAAVPLDSFEPTHANRVSPLHQIDVVPKNGGLLLRSSGDEPQVMLKPARPWGRGPFLVRLDTTAPADTVAQLYWKTPGLPFYCEPQSVQARIAPGRNIKYLLVPAKRIVGALRFDPAASPVATVLHSLEVRYERSA